MATKAELIDQVESYRRGNTELLAALMGMVHQFCQRYSQDGTVYHEHLEESELAFDVLERAGMMEVEGEHGVEGVLLWDMLAEREGQHTTRQPKTLRKVFDELDG